MGFVIRFQAPSNNNVYSIPISEFKWHCILCIIWQLVDTTVELANKVGASEIINRIVDDLKDENEQYRKMVMETIEKVTFTILFLTTLTSESQFLPYGFELNH